MINKIKSVNIVIIFWIIKLYLNNYVHEMTKF